MRRAAAARAPRGVGEGGGGGSWERRCSWHMANPPRVFFLAAAAVDFLSKSPAAQRTVLPTSSTTRKLEHFHDCRAAFASLYQLQPAQPYQATKDSTRSQSSAFSTTYLLDSACFSRGTSAGAAHFAPGSRVCSIHLQSVGWSRRRKICGVWSRAACANSAGRLLHSWRSLHTTVPRTKGLCYQEDVHRPPKLLVVQPRVHPQAVLRAKLYEAIRLADSLEELRDDDGGAAQKESPPYILVQSPEMRRSRKRGKRVRSDAYFGAGTVQNVGALVTATDSQKGLDAIFVNATLTAIQQRNLERAWGKPVLDRVGLIIEIFGAHAQTKEARLQVELAALNYKRSRLVRMTSKDGRLTFGMGFEAEVVSARGRGSGGRGFISGAGETEIQLQRRRISERKDRLLAMLEEVRRTRMLHRDARKKHGAGGHGNHIPLVAVVGYTNAGKSSLVAALSRSNLYIDDKLFATLDPRSRSVTLPSGKMVILSDTVGFISDLPIQLVKAFHATLEEVAEADFLLHVIDSSAANADEQRTAVLQVLETIGVPKDKMNDCVIEVWNKVDLSSSSSGNHSDSVKLDKLETMNLVISLPSENIVEEDVSSEEQDTIPESVLDKEEAAIENACIVDTASVPSESIVEEDISSEEQDTIYESVPDKEEAAIESTDAGPVVEYRTMSWSYEGIPRIGTSVVEGTGLKELLHLIDKKIISKCKPLS